MKTISRQNISDYIGYECQPTRWLTIDQTQIDRFGDVTMDTQYIHTDPERAKQTPFGGTIAHGFLTLSLLSQFAYEYSFQIEGTHTTINYGFDKVRLLSPVNVNSRIRAHAKFTDIIEKKPGQFLISSEVTIEIEGNDKPALIAKWLNMQITD